MCQCVHCLLWSSPGTGYSLLTQGEHRGRPGTHTPRPPRPRPPPAPQPEAFLPPLVSLVSPVGSYLVRIISLFSSPDASQARVCEGVGRGREEREDPGDDMRPEEQEQWGVGLLTSLALVWGALSGSLSQEQAGASCFSLQIAGCRAGAAPSVPLASLERGQATWGRLWQ